MRRLLLIILLCVSQAAWAGDYEDGVAAYKRSDYKTALAKFQSAAKQGLQSLKFRNQKHGRGISCQNRQRI
jgi:hypothetical protein